MRRALLDGTAPDQMGRGLAMAHHYRTINHYHTTGTGTEAMEMHPLSFKSYRFV